MKLLCYLWICFAFLAYAQDDSQRPFGCKKMGYRYVYQILEIEPRAEGDRESLYFFYNRSDEPIKLYQMLGNAAPMKTFLNHILEPKRWAVLITGEENVKYICAKHANEKELGDIVDCQSQLSVCEFPKTKFGLNNRGNFWLVQADSRENAVRQVERYGIIPG
jgi:hypothetical protein